MGPVFRAYQPEPGRLVAVKLFRLDLAPERVHQLVAALEGLVAIELAHPGIAAPVGAGLTGVSAYLAQDFVAAESLDVVVRAGGSASPAVVARVAAQLGSALDYAADLGVLHGALHPRDVMLSDDDARMTGLGVARVLEQVGIMTPVRRPYSAPERAVGGPWDGRADMYSLAALMFELLVGRRITGAGERAVTSLPEIAGTNRAALKRVFARALSADPRGRFPSGTAFAEALGLALVETHSSAVPLLFEPTDAAASVPEPASGGTPTGADSRSSARPSARPRARRPPAATTTEETLAADRLHGVEPDADAEVTRSLSTAPPAPPAQGTHAEAGPTASAVEDATEVALAANIHGGASGDVRGEPAEAPLLPIEAPGSSGLFGVVNGVVTGGGSGGGDGSSDVADLGATDRWDAPAQLVAHTDELAPYRAADSHVHDLDLHAGLHAVGVDGNKSALGVSLHSPTDPLRESSSESGPSPASLAPPFSAMTLESTRSAVWPLLLALGVGIAIGFGLAMVFFVGGGPTRQGDQIATTGRPGGPPEERPRPTALADEPIVSGTDAARPSAPALGATGRNGDSTPPGSSPAATAPADQVSASRAAPSPGPSPSPSPLPPTAPSTPLTAGAPVPARPQPAPASGRLLVRSTPLGAQVSVDGKSAGVTPLTLREVSRGSHTVRVAREGFVTVERRVTLSDALPAVTVNVDLARVRPAPQPAASVAASRRPSPPAAAGSETGALAVDSRPVGASVFIDGKLVGTTPLLIPTISATDHTISMELAGYTRWNSSVKVAPGERTRVAASLAQ